MENGKQPINPMPHQNQDGTIQHDVYFGLTKREYFAAMAMQGLISNQVIIRPEVDNEKQYLEFSRVCLLYADGLLKQLENK